LFWVEQRTTRIENLQHVGKVLLRKPFRVVFAIRLRGHLLGPEGSKPYIPTFIMMVVALGVFDVYVVWHLII
jgi:hypothetical protein